MRLDSLDSQEAFQGALGCMPCKLYEGLPIAGVIRMYDLRRFQVHGRQPQKLVVLERRGNGAANLEGLLLKVGQTLQLIFDPRHVVHSPM